MLRSLEEDRVVVVTQIIAKRKRTKRRAGVCGSVSSTEEEDMANCLILLARSGCRRRSLSNDEVNFDESSASEIRKLNKIETESSPSLIASGVNSNVVYECKTAFQSFQAFGGHRASHHKKPQNLFTDDHTTKVKPPTAKTSAILAVNKQPPSPATLESSSKVHECSICGSAFSSGQALGGHMRRHRTTVVAATNDQDNYSIRVAQTGKVAVLVSDRYIRNGNNISNNFLASLDLNLLAPAEEDRDEEQMSHIQRRMLFAATDQGSGDPSTTAPSPLVGCYF